MLVNIKEIAKGKWYGILSTIGLNEKQLSGKSTECPNCGGTDRFTYDNKYENGNYICRSCGAGDGISLVMKVRGIDFKDAVKEIEKAAGFVRKVDTKPAKSDDHNLSVLKRVWSESKPTVAGDEVSQYLANRGLIIPNGINTHSSLYYRDENHTGNYPAMIAKVQAPDGRGVSIHRTYLTDGKKAEVKDAKKLMSGLPMAGSAIRLFEHQEVLGVAEGIETAISAHIIHRVPVWSCVNAYGISSFEVPANVKKLIIFADNDASFTGQQSAYTLAKKAVSNGIECEVLIPKFINTDWCNELENM